MTDPAFEKQVKYNLTLFTAPDHTAKGDAVNFFKNNSKRVIPILEQLAEKGDKTAKQMLEVARNANDDKPKKKSFMENNPDLF